MISSFNFKPFRDKILMTNDMGRFAFLSIKEFEQFVQGRLDDDEKKKQLEEDFFYYEGSQEAFLQRAQEAIRNNRSYLFIPTSLYIVALTNKCNNNCIYCQASGKLKGTNMPISVAQKIVERLAESPSKNMTIEFQGGEPLMNFDAMKHIVLQAEKELSDRHVEFALVSNLALLNEDIADFLAEHQVSVSTSIDGPRELHDKNRPTYFGHGSFDVAVKGLECLRKRGMDPSAIQTTTRAALNMPREIVKAYADLGFTSIFLRPLTRLGAAALRWKEIGYTAEEYIDFYQDALAEIITMNKQGKAFRESLASVFLSKILSNRAPNYMELRSPCGAGIGQMAFTASGDVFTCDEGRMLAEVGDYSFRIGNIFDNGYSDWIESNICKAICSASLLESIPSCCDCVYQPYCGVCPVINYAMEGNLVSKCNRNERCKIYQGIQDILMSYILEDDKETIEIFEGWQL